MGCEWVALRGWNPAADGAKRIEWSRLRGLGVRELKTIRIWADNGVYGGDFRRVACVKEMRTVERQNLL